MRVLPGSQLKVARVLQLFNPNSATIQHPTITTPTSGVSRFDKISFYIKGNIFVVTLFISVSDIGNDVWMNKIPSFGYI